MEAVSGDYLNNRLWQLGFTRNKPSIWRTLFINDLCGDTQGVTRIFEKSSR